MKMTDSNTITNCLETTKAESLESSALTRLDSWKAIADYLNRNVRTAQRWETLEAMPVHRHGHETGHSVYAYKQEIDAWRSHRSLKARPTLRVSAIRQIPLDTLVPAEQSALLRSLVVLVEYLQKNATRLIAELPDCDSLRQVAARDGLSVAAEDPKSPRPAERLTISDTIGRPLFVACGRLKADQ
jgi:hypothetical protein